MSWLPLLRALLQLASFVATRVRDEELRQSGEARLLVKQLEDLHERMYQAALARGSEPPADRLRDDDGHRRD